MVTGTLSSTRMLRRRPVSAIHDFFSCCDKVDELMAERKIARGKYRGNGTTLLVGFCADLNGGTERRLFRGTGETIRLRLVGGGEFQQCTILSRWPRTWRVALRVSTTSLEFFTIAG